MISKEEWEKKLSEEGFKEIYEWKDVPNATYPPHVHETDVAHIIIDGSMTLAIEGKTQVLRPGDRATVPAGRIHEATIGPIGCKYLVGEK